MINSLTIIGIVLTCWAIMRCEYDGEKQKKSKT